MKASTALLLLGSILWVLGGVILGAVLVAAPYPSAGSEALDGLVLIAAGFGVNFCARQVERREKW